MPSLSWFIPYSQMVCQLYCSSLCEKLQMDERIGAEKEGTERLPYLSRYGIGNCRSLPKKAGLRKSCGKNCRIKWNNPRMDLVQIESGFSPEEEELIIKLHATIGSRWTIIAQQLPGRTDNEVKNYWNKRLKKKLTAIGIDPITHRPFSQILADYGNIGGCPKFQNHFSLKGDIRNEVMLKPELPFSPPQSSAEVNSHFDTRISLPEAESSKDQLLTSTNNLTDDNSNPLDLLSQLHAITMVTDSFKNTSTPGTSARIPTECISSSASSSPLDKSPPSATNKVMVSSKFSWCDFLLEDAFLPANVLEQENGWKFSLNKQEQQAAAAAKNGNHTSNKTTEDSSVSNGSFVEAMLDRETEMLSDFHRLLEEPFYY